MIEDLRDLSTHHLLRAAVLEIHYFGSNLLTIQTKSDKNSNKLHNHENISAFQRKVETKK